METPWAILNEVDAVKLRQKALGSSVSLYPPSTTNRSSDSFSDLGTTERASLSILPPVADMYGVHQSASMPSNSSQFEPVLFSHKEPPLELKDISAAAGNNIDYVTFVLFPCHPSARRDNAINLSGLSALPHQVLEGLYSHLYSGKNIRLPQGELKNQKARANPMGNTNYSSIATISKTLPYMKRQAYESTKPVLLHVSFILLGPENYLTRRRGYEEESSWHREE
ncbi:hypothetical protein GH733_019410 [Mirounga leonina]|nr:hypothetical protein GH733_019410 [Mirounga leonina]